MRILHLTAGTGRWHCGTCIRDDGLVKALRALGHDADLVPLYLPVVADGVSCAAGQPVRMSGVNVYLQHASPLFRVTPAWVDAAFSSGPVMGLASRFAGSTRPESLGALTVSMLRGEDGVLRKEVTRLVDHLATRPKPHAILISNAMLAGLAPAIRRALRVPVLVTVQGEAHFLDVLGPWRDEAWALVAGHLESCDGRIAVSAFAADLMAARTGLRRAMFDVAPNGVPVEGIEPPDFWTTPSDTPAVGFLARLTAAKGLDRFAQVAIRVAEAGVPARFVVAGSALPGERPVLDAFRATLRDAGLADRLTVLPDLDVEAKRAFLRRLSVLCVPTAKDDTSGLYNLEAMAAGVPVVAPRRGALPEAVEALGGGLLVPPDDDAAAADAVLTLLRDHPRAVALGRAGWDGVRASRSDVHMARGIVRAIERAAGRTIL